jgi:PAS domain S-box-containing protein
MSKTVIPKAGDADLRRTAEEKLKKTLSDVPVSVEDPHRLLHELQVHQIELEMQNAELRQAHDDREALLDQYSELYNFTPIGYFTLLGDGKIEDINLAGATMLGSSRSQLIGRSFSSFLSPASLTVFNDFHTKVFSSAVKQTCEVALSTHQETSAFLHLEANASTSAKFYHLVALDISERKQLEAVQEKLIAAIEQTEEMIVITDAEANIQYVNPAFEGITGYRAAEALGQNPRILKSGEQDDLFYRQMWSTLTSGQSWKGRLTNKKRDGTLYVEDATISPVRDALGKIVNYVATKNDITEKLHAEQQQYLRHKMEAVGYLAGGMAHNLNNYLSIILGNLELTQMKQKPGSEVITYLEDAKTAVRRSRDLVQSIITYSRKGRQKKSPTILTVVIEETIALLRSILPSTINLKTSYSTEGKTIQINADASQLHEIIINLCNNAVQAMDEKGDLKILVEPVTLKQAEMTAQYDCSPGRYAKISVQDSGCGIPEAMLGKIFDPFFTTKEDYEGAGMGLATVQGIVAQHGGMIKVNSTLTQGTTFELYFPQIEESCETITTTQNEILPQGTEQILYVDDDEMLAKLTERMLSEAGYRVSMMTQSREALKLFVNNAERFDLVITDQTMPELTGKELIQEIKKIRPDIPTILCTGYSSKIDQDSAKELGIGAFMMKPVEFSQLLQTMRRLLDGVDNR